LVLVSRSSPPPSSVLPWTVYFGTENRDVSFVTLLSALVLLVLHRHLATNSWASAAALTVLGSLMLYSHYWSLYFLAVIAGAGAWRLYPQWIRQGVVASRRGDGPGFCHLRAVARDLQCSTAPHGYAFAGAGDLSGFQLATGFHGQSRAFTSPCSRRCTSSLSLITFGLFLLLGVLGCVMAERSREMTLKWTVPDDARWLSFVALGTLVAGIVAGHYSHSAYVPRYAAVVMIPLCLLVARGISTLGSSLRILAAIAVMSALSLWTDKWGVHVQRTQAGQIAKALSTVPSRSLVAVCPDQLGPSLLRYANPTLKYVAYPRLDRPDIIDWYDYKEALDATTPAKAASAVASTGSAHQRLFVVRAHGYNLTKDCLAFANDLAADTHRTGTRLVKEQVLHFYQSMSLTEYVAPSATTEAPATKSRVETWRTTTPSSSSGPDQPG
jgi:hypothetical protein